MNPKGRKPRMLFVEDEALVAEVVIEELSDAGFDVIHVASGEQALGVFDDASPLDVLFTDIRLAGKMDGWELAEAVRERGGRKIPVIYATGYSVDEPRQVADSELLAKPYRPSEVLRLAQRLGLTL